MFFFCCLYFISFFSAENDIKMFTCMFFTCRLGAIGGLVVQLIFLECRNCNSKINEVGV
ncbi:hypothetical protein GLYMA_07G159950v4 [Glycine max]|nr:hypothetical protein GLYMA_07G159950v4 [Glycine max]KAH1087092.1 hypothetical protein GYH30_018567 [Glycine max]